MSSVAPSRRSGRAYAGTGILDRLRPDYRIILASAALTVAVLSLLPAKGLPTIGVGDKAEHVVAYAFLTVVGLKAYRRTATRLRILIALVAFGVGLETLQAYSPGRATDLADVIANIFGMTAGALVHLLYDRVKYWLNVRNRRRPGFNGVPLSPAQAVLPE